MTAAQQKVKIKLPSGFSVPERLAIAEDIIDLIKRRARIENTGVVKTGDGFRRKAFPKYTNEYAKKKGQSSVDLTLSSEMLDDISLLTHTSQSVTIGHEKGTLQNEKAEGNQIGSYGRPKGNPSKARRYLGITKSELNDILKAYKEMKAKNGSR